MNKRVHNVYILKMRLFLLCYVVLRGVIYQLNHIIIRQGHVVVISNQSGIHILL